MDSGSGFCLWFGLPRTSYGFNFAYYVFRLLPEIVNRMYLSMYWSSAEGLYMGQWAVRWDKKRRIPASKRVHVAVEIFAVDTASTHLLSTLLAHWLIHYPTNINSNHGIRSDTTDGELHPSRGSRKGQ